MRLKQLPFGPALAALVLGVPLAAQTVTTGAINGTIKGSGGQPLEGVTVRITSGQITRTALTKEDGRYTLWLLNAGSWSIQVGKEGYALQRVNVSVNINTTATANFKLVKEGSAVVEVVGSVSNIDATSTTTGANYSMDTLSALPIARDISDIAFLTPGVTSSGFGKSLGLDLSISGGSGAENSFSIDGLTTNDMRYGGGGINLVSDFVEQVDVQTGGFKPEYSSLGGVFNVVTKSGSNTFAGSAWATDTPSSLKPGPKENRFTKEDAANSRYDAGFWAGGAFLPDRLFYSVGFDYNSLQQPAQSNLSNLPLPKATKDTYQLFAKVNAYLNGDNQITLSYFGAPSNDKVGHSNTLQSIGDGRGTADGGGETKINNANISLIWDSVLTPTMNLSVKVGQAKIDNTVTPANNVDPLVNDSLWYSYQAHPTDPTQWGIGYIYSSGGYGLVINEHNTTKQASFDFNWVLGTHALKIGASRLDSEYALEEHYPGGARYSVDMRAGLPRLRQRVITNDATVKASYDAVYVQDSWDVSRALKVFYGFRMESQDQKDSTGKSFLKFNFADYIQPRLGFTWDVMGNSRSKLSGSYAVYYEKIPQRMAIREFGGEKFNEYRYGGGYTEPGNTFTYDPTNPNHYGTFSGTPYPIDYGKAFNNPPVQDGIKLPKRTEYQLGYSQQVSNEITLGIQGHYRKLTHPIEDSVITDAAGNTADPNGMALIWNPQPGPISFNKSDGTGNITVADTLYPEAYNTYKAVDLTFEWKGGSDYLHATYTWSRLEGNYEGVVSSSNGQADGNITASWDYYPYVGKGLLPLDRTHTVKIYGTHTFQIADRPLHAGFSFLFQSGVPYGLWDDGSSSTPKIDDTLFGQYGDSTPQNGKIGNKGRTPTHTNLDLNLNYEIVLNNKVKFVPMFSIFNLLNARDTKTVLEQAMDSGATPYPAGKWASATSWYAGRSVLLGLKCHF